MYIITAKSDNRIIMMGEQLDYMDNGYPRLVNENVAFPTQIVFVNGQDVSEQPELEPIEVPEGVKAEEYCYTVADGFYENPNHVDPTTEE